jgi:hypothetical protein
VVYSVIPHPVADISKVAPDKGESIIVNDVFFGIGILVEAEQMPLFTQSPQYFATMSTAAKGNIHIDPMRMDV